MKTTRQSHYSKKDLVSALKDAGIHAGHTVLSHSNIGYFGIPLEGNSRNIADRMVLEAFQEVLGEGGTLIVPTYTYSFCRRQVFDPSTTPSTCGSWSEFVRTRPEACRSHDPIFSVAALGGRAEKLTAAVPIECFGPDSFWERFLKADGIICNLNVWVISTFIHYVEKLLRVPYRYDKLFPGMFSIDGKIRRGSAIFFCQDASNADTRVATDAFDEMAINTGLAKRISVGRGFITVMRAQDVVSMIKDTLVEQPYFLTEAGRHNRIPLLIQPNQTKAVALGSEASMHEIIEALYQLPRDIVSDGYDVALSALAKQLPMRIHEFPSGSECLTWIIPEKWTCKEAFLETLDGHRLFSYSDHPLHVVSYSLPFDSVVSKEELFKHLHVHPLMPNAIPFIFKYYERDWGLCCSRQMRDTLMDEQYRVVINAEFSYSTLKVGEVILPGETDECIVLCAHLCHPGQVNDDLSGVAVGLEVMRRLMKLPARRYTYRFIILPETIGSAAWISRHEHLIPKLAGGIFLEMLARGNAFTLQRSFSGSTELDRCFELAVTHLANGSHVIPFMAMNDERQFNAPGIRVPMVALYRILPDGHTDWPYREYHSNLDDLSQLNPQHLEESCAIVLRMIETVEQNAVPEPLFKGELFMSRYGLHIDWYQDRHASESFFNILYRIDGTRTIATIAQELNIPFQSVRSVANQLVEAGLCRLHPASSH